MNSILLGIAFGFGFPAGVCLWLLCMLLAGAVISRVDSWRRHDR